MNRNLTLTVRLPGLSVVPSHRGGFKIRGSLGLRSFAAVVRHIPGRLVYTTTEAGERRSKGWAAVDDEIDVTKHVAELLMWAATAEVEGRMMVLARQACPGRDEPA